MQAIRNKKTGKWCLWDSFISTMTDLPDDELHFISLYRDEIIMSDIGLKNNGDYELVKVKIELTDEEKLKKGGNVIIPYEEYIALKKPIEKAIDDTFNQVHYSFLHPDLVPPISHDEWKEKWIKENKI